MKAKEFANATRHLTLAMTAREYGLSHVTISSGEFSIETTIFTHNDLERETARQLVTEWKMVSDETCYTNLSDSERELHTWVLRTEWNTNE